MAEISTPDELRHRLTEIDDELRDLPDDAFAGKYELHSEADRLKAKLHELLSADLDGVGQEWADRSARKASHTVDYEAAAVMAAVRNPGDAP